MTDFLLGLAGIYLILIIAFVIGTICVFIYVIYEMASQRGRNAGMWLFLSLVIINPLLVMLCLFCLGETDEKRRERLLKDEDYLRMWRD